MAHAGGLAVRCLFSDEDLEAKTTRDPVGAGQALGGRRAQSTLPDARGRQPGPQLPHPAQAPGGIVKNILPHPGRRSRCAYLRGQSPRPTPSSRAPSISSRPSSCRQSPAVLTRIVSQVETTQLILLDRSQDPVSLGGRLPHPERLRHDSCRCHGGQSGRDSHDG